MLAPLDVFVDYLCTTGLGRLRIVRDLKQKRGYPFYAPFVAEVRAMHERAGTLHPDVAARELPALLHGQAMAAARSGRPDARKARIFPRLANGYVKALESLGPTTWRAPVEATVRLAELEVVVAHDLCLVPEQDMATPPRPYLINLSLPAEPLAEHRVVLSVFLMRLALAEKMPESVYGVLDVPRSRLFTPSPKPEGAGDMLTLLRGEAAGFVAMWDRA